MNSEILLPQPSVPGGGGVLNPFVIVDDAAGFVHFVSAVIDVAENVEVRTQMPDGKLIHAQLRLGGVDLMIADRLDGWPLRPGCSRYRFATSRRCCGTAALRALPRS
jgi:PhnB protein